ncbi:MAG: homoserine kinase [Pseudomonadota bacterium]
MQTFKIKVPGSSANIGPGFDCVGLAISVYLEVECILNDNQDLFAFNLKGEGSDIVKDLECNFIYKSLYHSLADKSLINKITINAKNEIPLQAGMGSSGAAIVAGVALAFLLESKAFDKNFIFKKALEIETHPDNIIASIFGGFNIVTDPENIKFKKLVLDDDLYLTCIIPQLQTSTKAAREVLPSQFSMKETVLNTSHMAYLTASLLTKDYNSIKEGLKYNFHEEARAKLIPNYFEILQELRQSKEAYGVYISGSGPVIAAFCNKKSRIGELGVSLFYDKNINARFELISPDNEGLIINN